MGVGAGGDDAVLARVRDICLALPGAEEAELQGRPLFRVGRRRFAIFNADSLPRRLRWQGSGRSVHFLADPVERTALGQDVRLTSSPHHGDRGWFALDLQAEVDWVEVAELLHAAHAQVYRPGGTPGLLSAEPGRQS